MVVSPIHLNQAIRPVSVDVVPSFHIILIDSGNEVRVAFCCVIAVIGEIDVGSPAKVLIVEIHAVDTDIYTTGAIKLSPNCNLFVFTSDRTSIFFLK